MGITSIWHWIILLGIIILLFGTKKLGNLGTDLGNAIRGFKSAMKSGDQEESSNLSSSPNTTTPPQKPLDHQANGSRVIDVHATRETDQRL